MPYISQEEREDYYNVINDLCTKFAVRGFQPGHFNYIVSVLINYWFLSNRRYITANSIIGVLECIKQEFYRRQLAPYEDVKIKENGDI